MLVAIGRWLMRDETIVCVVAITAIMVLEAIALAKGLDHGLLATAFSVIGSIVGYMFGRFRRRRMGEG